MSIAIIILNYNDYENTKKYVNLIKEYNAINKIIIVDNNSTDKEQVNKLKELVSDKVDLVLSDKNGGYAYGNNYGLKYLEQKYPNMFEYVIISNPDVFVEEDTINYLEEYMIKNPNVAIAAPRMYFKDGVARRSAWKERKILIDIANSTRITELLLYPFFKSGEYSKYDYLKEVLKVDAIAGSFFMANFNIFKKIGYFDENTFLFYEEDIIGKKIFNINYEIHCLNNIKFIHYDSQTIGKVMNTFRKVNILFDSKIYYHKKYNNANIFQIFIFYMLKYIRKFELLFEIPIRKILKK